MAPLRAGFLPLPLPPPYQTFLKSARRTASCRF